MARYIGPVCRLCRREGMKLFLKGERCYTEKCAIEKRNFAPGQHGKTRKAEARGLRPPAAREAEGQAHLRRARGPVPALLRGGGADPRHHGRDAAAAARTAARQRRLSARPRDIAAAGAAARSPRPLPGQRQEGGHPVLFGQAGRPRHRARPEPEEPDPRTRDGGSQRTGAFPAWLSFDPASIAGRVVSMPTREQINLPVQEQLIVELYSK